MIKRVVIIAVLLMTAVPVYADDNHTYDETVIIASTPPGDSWGTSTDANVANNGTLLTCTSRVVGGVQRDYDLTSFNGGASFLTLPFWGGASTRGGSCDFIDNTNEYGRVYTDTGSNIVRFARYDMVNRTVEEDTAISAGAGCCNAEVGSINLTHHVVMWASTSDSLRISNTTDGGATWTTNITGFTTDVSGPRYGYSCISAPGTGKAQCVAQTDVGVRFFDIDPSASYTVTTVTNYGTRGYQPDLFYDEDEDAYGVCAFVGSADLRYFRSTNGGSSWVNASIDSAAVIAEECSVDKADNNIVGVLNEADFYHSADNGATWGAKNRTPLHTSCCNGPDVDMVKQSAGFMLYGADEAATTFSQWEVTLGPAAATTTTTPSVFDNDGLIWGGNKSKAAEAYQVTEAGLEMIYAIGVVLFFMAMGAALGGIFGAAGASIVALVINVAFGWIPPWMAFLMFFVLGAAVLWIHGFMGGQE